MYFRYFLIISPLKKAGLFNWTNLNSLHRRWKCKKVYRQTDGRTDGQADWRRTKVIRKVHLSFQLGELKKFHLLCPFRNTNGPFFVKKVSFTQRYFKQVHFKVVLDKKGSWREQQCIVPNQFLSPLLNLLYYTHWCFAKFGYNFLWPVGVKKKIV